MVGIASVPIGIDVQVLADEATLSEVGPLLHPLEQQEISSAAAPRRAELFTRLWTRKEAYLKALGTGIAHGLEGEYVGSQRTDAVPGWRVIDLPVAAGYSAATALFVDET